MYKQAYGWAFLKMQQTYNSSVHEALNLCPLQAHPFSFFNLKEWMRSYNKEENQIALQLNLFQMVAQKMNGYPTPCGDQNLCWAILMINFNPALHHNI